MPGTAFGAMGLPGDSGCMLLALVSRAFTSSEGRVVRPLPEPLPVEAPKLKYYGALMPPEALEWVGGWWCSQTPHWAGSGYKQTWRENTCRPDVVLATVGNFQHYADTVLYLPVTTRMSNCFEVRAGVVTDGIESMQVFDTNSVLGLMKSKYSVQWSLAPGTRIGVYRLVRVRTNWRDSLRMTARGVINKVIPVSWKVGDEPAECHASGDPDVSTELRTKAKWLAVARTEKSALKTALLSRGQQDSAKDWAKAGDADDFKRYIDSLASTFPDISEVKGGYKWGDCYSCGKQFPGKFEGRICSNCHERNATQAGELVAEGVKICGLAVPIRYPGVVNTKTRHPPLKKGTDTFATEANFRLSPSGRRSLSRRHQSGGVAPAWLVLP